MKKTIPMMLVLILCLAPVSAFSFSTVKFLFTTDILEILDKDYQLQFEYVLGSNTSFTMRVGYYRTLEDSNNIYANNVHHWEIGSRYRWFALDNAPHLLFLGVGFDNRPQDNTVTPLGEIGIQLNLKPLTASLVGFGGYEWHWKNSSANRWVKGIEIRAGICF
ncbi:MAG: hypothetical protein KAX11_08165 [Candidatus Aminicenantes bacterium]|nr:hypothetical protein [Candidatus Aminicenantes bacterium]